MWKQFLPSDSQGECWGVLLSQKLGIFPVDITKFLISAFSPKEFKTCKSMAVISCSLFRLPTTNPVDEVESHLYQAHLLLG